MHWYQRIKEIYLSYINLSLSVSLCATPLVARLMGPTWGPSGADRTQVGLMLAPWTLLSGTHFCMKWMKTVWYVVIQSHHQNLYSLNKSHLTGIWIPITKLRRSDDGLMSIMGIPVAISRCRPSESRAIVRQIHRWGHLSLCQIEFKILWTVFIS